MTMASVSVSATNSQARARVSDSLEPLTEVEGALLVVEILHAPHPEGLGLLLVVGGEHSAAQHTTRLRLGVHRRSSGVGCSRRRLRAHALHCLSLPSDMVRARCIICCGGACVFTAHRGGRKDRACAGCTPERHRTAVVVTAMHDDAARALGVARAHARPSAHNLPMHTSVCACVAKRHGKKGGSKLFLRLFWLRVSELELFWRG